MKRWRGVSRGGSGPRVARLYGRLLALIFLVAWLSLGVQVDVLVGRHGLLPAAPFADALRAQGVPFLVAPTLFRWGASDAALSGGIALGVLLSLLALAGVAPRLCFAAGTLLYLSYAVIARTFLGFQWDNLLLEAGFLAVFLPRERRAWAAHLALRVLLFKLYFESGVAKWESPLHDWHDGSAMTFYYETAPIPTALAWYAHGLPASWHAFEGWFTLFFELVVPFAIFGPRRARLSAAVLFTGFQVVNIATANYGFFSYLALALHVFLLDDSDVDAVSRRLLGRFPRLRRVRLWARWIELAIHRRTPRLGALGSRLPARQVRLARLAAEGTGLAAYVAVSLEGGAVNFTRSGGDLPLAALYQAASALRIVNTYHLFAAITRERIEPELQTSDGARPTNWTAHDLRYKPGDVTRAPVFVAPHQPRVDFQLWFVGLGFQGGTPSWVNEMMHLTCTSPDRLRSLFREALPRSPRLVRMAYYRYTFTTPAERRATGAVWKRELLTTTRPIPCP